MDSEDTHQPRGTDDATATGPDTLLDELVGPDTPAHGETGAPATGGRPAEVRAIMVSALTGSAAVDGTSGGLGNDLDAALLAAVRQWADAVLVGAGTVRAEDYGPVCPDPDYTARRAARGQAAAPVLAVLSGSLALDTSARLFAACRGEAPGARPPLILTDSSGAASARAETLRSAGAEVVDTGGGDVRAAVDTLVARGARRIVCEGGPSLLGAEISADLIDVLYLTLSPVLSGAVEQPLVTGAETTARPMELENLHRDADSTLFLRYRRRR